MLVFLQVADMRYWLIHAGEPLPTDGDVRLFRYGILSSMLADRGHEAVQWAGTFNHFLKKQRATSSQGIRVDEKRRVELLYGRGYQRHIGLDRIRTNREVASEFRRRAEQVDRPDAIVVSLPTLELAEEAVAFGKRSSVPVIVDVRDLWPDVHLKILPSSLRPLGRLALTPSFRKAKRICREATALTGVSEGYLKWGLAMAGRDLAPTDKVFSHGYLKPSLTEIQREAAEKQIAEKGVSVTEKVRFCFFGTLGQSCGLEYVIDAVRQLTAEEQQMLEIVVCGTGPRSAEYERQAEGLASIRFLGWATSSELIKLMELSDVGLALYSANAPQSLPNKPIEYMAGGLPLLSTLTGELQTFLDNYDCGYTVSPGDTDAMVTAIRKLINEKSIRERFSKNVLELYEKYFSAERVYSKMIDYLEELARQNMTEEEMQGNECLAAA